MITGVINKDGSVDWIRGINGRDFSIEKVGIGLYRIFHNLGTKKYFCGLGNEGDYASYAVIEKNENNCLAAFTDMEGKQKDVNFSFSLMWDGDDNF